MRRGNGKVFAASGAPPSIRHPDGNKITRDNQCMTALMIGVSKTVNCIAWSSWKVQVATRA